MVKRKFGPPMVRVYACGHIALLCKAMSNRQPPTTLAMAFTKRLAQLGISRREFTRLTGVSRQTLHNIEVEGRTVLAPATLAALDRGCRWQPGTALALAHGDDSVLADADVWSREAKANELRWLLVERITRMSLEDLETMAYQWNAGSSNGHTED